MVRGILIPSLRTTNNGLKIVLENKVDTIRCPDVIGAVELEENEKRNEDARDTSKISIDKEVLGGRSDIVVEAILIDINTEENAAGNEENVVVDELFGNGIVEGGRAWGCGVKLAEWVEEELGWGQEEVDGDKTEYLA